MPKLLLFAPCQKAIIDREEMSVSMIAILSGITVGIQGRGNGEATNVPPNAAAPFSWGAVSIWLREPDDDDKAYEQRLQIQLPDGSEAASAEVSFAMTARTHQVAVRGNVFPFGGPGEYVMKLCVREVGTSEWRVASEFPLEVKQQVIVPEDEVTQSDTATVER